LITIIFLKPLETEVFLLALTKIEYSIMKKVFGFKEIFSLCLLFIPIVLIGQTTFHYTGGVQYYTVPKGVKFIQIKAYGAQGGGDVGGRGGQVIATVPVIPGSKLEVHVGGRPSERVGPIQRQC